MASLISDNFDVHNDLIPEGIVLFPAPMLIYFQLFLIEFKIDRSNWTMDYVWILYEVFWEQQIGGLVQ